MKTLQDQLIAVKKASYDLPFISHEIKTKVIKDIADALILEQNAIINENQADLARLDPNDPKYDRLLLNPERILSMANSLNELIHFDSPIHQIVEEKRLPNGLLLQRITVPFGVIGMIYESRPNVTLDAFALTFLSSNACVLKGGSEAVESNKILCKIICDCLKKENISTDIILLMPPTRDAVMELLSSPKYIDVIIPRGSQSLINFVKQNSQIPIIETGAGVVHVFFDRSGDIEKGKKIITNAKTRRVSVCNALDCLIIHQDRLIDLPALLSDLVGKQVMLLADEPSFTILEDIYPQTLLEPATNADFGTEFLALKMAIKTVENFDDAIEHIRNYSSSHSDAIIAEDKNSIQAFFDKVDSAVVYANASTAFTDGGEFGMGGEIGISTQKLHVRGPFSMQHLVSSKWQVTGNGQIRS